MSVASILDSLINDADEAKITLDNLILELQGEVIESEDPNLYPAPDVDENDVWTLIQNNDPDTDGVYVGIYKLPNDQVCAKIRSVTVIQPTSPLPTARVLPCGADPVTGWVNLTSVNDLVGQEFNKFEIRSSAAFEVQVRLAACFIYDFQNNEDRGFALDTLGTDPSEGAVGTLHATWGWVNEQFSTVGNTWGFAIARSIPATTIKGIKVNFFSNVGVFGQADTIVYTRVILEDTQQNELLNHLYKPWGASGARTVYPLELTGVWSDVTTIRIWHRNINGAYEIGLESIEIDADTQPAGSDIC